MKKSVLLLSMFIFCSVGLQAQGIDNQWGFINTIPDYGAGSHLGAIYALSEDTVFLTAMHGKFYRSLDGGLTWTSYDSNIDEDFVDLKFLNDTIGFAVGTNGSIAKSVDAGQTWILLPSGTGNDLTSLWITGENDIWAVGAAGTLLHSTDMGADWGVMPLTYKRLNSIAFVNDTVGYIAGNDGALFKTTNGGAKWHPVSLDLDADTDDLFSMTIAGGIVHILCGYSFGGYSFGATQMVETTDGSNWTLINLGSIENIYMTGMGISAIAFKNATAGYGFYGEASMCSCCKIWIYKFDGSAGNLCFQYESGGNSSCVYNFGFANISLVGNAGYLFQGNVLKLHGGDSYKVKGFEKIKFKIYPNPVLDRLTIAFGEMVPEASAMKIFDVTGQRVFWQDDLGVQTTISVDGFSQGIYFLKISSQGKTLGIKKFVKK